jgi:hypothetical protein
VGFEFLDRVRRTSVATGLIVSLAVWIYAGPAGAGAFLLGCAWSLLNIHLLRILVRLAVNDPKSQKLRIGAVLILKVPVLYGVGYLLIETKWLPVVGLLAGFVWPMTVVTLKAVGRLVLGLDETERASAGSNSGGVQRGI